MSFPHPPRNEIGREQGDRKPREVIEVGHPGEREGERGARRENDPTSPDLCGDNSRYTDDRSDPRS